MDRMRIGSVVMVGSLVLAASAWAVKPETWTHEQPKDFTTGQMKEVVVNSRGELMLGRASKILHDAEKSAEAINALAQAGDGKIYAATGPNGVIYRVDGEDVTEFAKLADGNVFSLLFAKDGRLLAGTGGGEQAKIYVIDGKGKSSVFYEPKDAKYVWAMARGTKGEVYAATGVEGQLFRIDADGKNGKVLADLKPKNLLCLAFGGDGMLYLGTDEDGLVYRVDPDSGKSYVMYDAKEAEISSIVVDREGNIYAATAAAEQAHPGRAVADKPGGKPDNESSKEGSKPSGHSTSKPADDDKSKSETPAVTPPSSPPRKLNGISLQAMLASRAATSKASSHGASPTSGASAGGNAIYRIDTFGFVMEVFREPVVIYDMVEAKGTIYAGTGNEGRIYMITPNEDVKTMIAKLEPNQVTALLRLDSGELLAGTANAPKLVRVSEGYTAKGTLVSTALDAGQIVKWGRVWWDASVPQGTKLTVAIRSSNVEDIESDAWEDWSDEMDATQPQQIASSGARFLQYRLTMESTVPNRTATLRKISIARIEENRPPVIGGLEVLSVPQEAKKPASNPKVKQLANSAGYGDEQAPTPQYHWVVKWSAEDPNGDDLMYEVFYRKVYQRPWIRLAKELKEPLHIWDTRTVPDGRYEVRVVATDKMANALGNELEDARISDPFLLDNTPPEVRIEKIEKVGASGLRVEVAATDALSAVAEAGYRVDSEEESRSLAPDDDVFDSPRETITFTLQDLDKGDHWISVRVSDAQGNARYVSQLATVGD